MALWFSQNGVIIIRGGKNANADMTGIKAFRRPKIVREKPVNRWATADERRLEKLREKLVLIRIATK